LIGRRLWHRGPAWNAIERRIQLARRSRGSEKTLGTPTTATPIIVIVRRASFRQAL